MKSENIDAISQALSKAQAEIYGAIKDSTNPFFKAGYADLASVWDAIRGPLTKNNLCVTQTMTICEGKPVLVTRLSHSSGQWIESLMPVLAQKQDPQSLGSAITYARRYSLAAMVCLPQIDDDGEAAMNRPKDITPDGDKTPDKEFVVTFGKYKDRVLTTIPKKELQEYCGYIKKAAAGKEINGPVAEFLKEAGKLQH
jgi:hypothetical protein